MLTKEDDDMADLHLSDGEWKLMKVLWQQSPRTLGALVAALAPTTGWSKATVFMMLKRLIAKGAVSLDESGKYQQYSAAVAYAEVEPEETASFLTKVYGGSVGLMVSNLVGRGADRKVELIVRLAIGSLVHKLHQTDRRRSLERGNAHLDRLSGSATRRRPSSRTRRRPRPRSSAATANQRKRQRARGKRRGKSPARHFKIKRAHR